LPAVSDCINGKEMNQNGKRAAMPVSMSRNGAEHGFTILNVVVWLAVAFLLPVFVPQAYSVMQVNTELRRVAALAQQLDGDICYAKNPDLE
jgi:hypothetical protein